MSLDPAIGNYGAPAQQPAIPIPTAANLTEVAERVKEMLEIWQGSRGDGLDRVLTVRDLLNVGALDPESAGAIYESGGQYIPPSIPPRPPQPATPPTPKNLVVSGAVGIIILDWEFPFDYTRLSHFEVWRSATDALGDAVLVAQPYALVWADEVGLDASFYYWVRAVSDGGVSPFNAVAGTHGETPSAFETVPDGENNGEPVTAGVYLRDVRIKNGAIDTAKIGNLAVVDAKVANMNVAKLLAGNIAVGQYIQSADYSPGFSGFRLQTTSEGFAFLDIRGGAWIGGLEVGATFIQSENYIPDTSGYRFNSDGTGQLGGLIVTTDGIESSNYDAGTATGFRLTYDGVAYVHDSLNGGDFTSYAWPAGSGTGYHLSKNGLLLGNPSTGSYFQVSGAGEVSAPGFSITGGTGTFSGALNAATGTFSGTLTAAAVNAVDTINLAGNAVTIPISSYTAGDFSINTGGADLNATGVEGTFQTLPTFTSKGGRVVINCGFAVRLGRADPSDTLSGVVLRIRRNGTELIAVNTSFTADDAVFNMPPINDLPGSGVSVTYTATIQYSGGTSAAYLSSRGMTSMEAMR